MDIQHGNDLFRQVVALTGLPEESIVIELHKILRKIGADPANITMDDLRKATLVYMSEILQAESVQ